MNEFTIEAMRFGFLAWLYTVKWNGDIALVTACTARRGLKRALVALTELQHAAERR